MYTDLTTFCVGREETIHQAITRMDIVPKGIVLVVDKEGRLLGIVTDGDVRRAILAEISPDEPVGVLIDLKVGTAYGKPITALASSDPGDQLALLQEHNVLHLPLVDEEQRVTALVTLWREVYS